MTILSMTILSVTILSMTSGGLYLAIVLVKAMLCLRVNRRQVIEPVPGLPDIAIVQPILSGDPNLSTMLQRNLSGTTVSDHRSHVRFYWMIDRDDRIAIEVCTRLAAEFPSRVEIIECEACPEDENPKVFKLRVALRMIEEEYFAVLDDDTRITSEDLSSAIGAMPENDLVTGLPAYESCGSTIWSSLVAHFVNNNSVMTYLPLLNFRDPVSINGMFYVMRTETLMRLDPFKEIRYQVCDDFAIANFCRANHLRMRQLTTSQKLRTHVGSRRQYLRLMHRWFVFANHLVVKQTLSTQLPLILLLGLPPILLWISLPAIFGGWLPASFLFCQLVTRHFLIRYLHSRVLGSRPPFSWWVSILAELLQPVHLIGSAIRPTIVWRGKPMRIDCEGRRSAVNTGWKFRKTRNR